MMTLRKVKIHVIIVAEVVFGPETVLLYVKKLLNTHHFNVAFN